MDSLTHIAIGAVIGEAFAGKTIGKRAMLVGAVFQSIPDIDFVAAFFLSPTANLIAHRGFTHSLLFGAIMTFAIAFAFARWKHFKSVPFRQWVFFSGLEILVHLLLDACNAYGVGWFEPFSQDRIAFNLIFVADPFYSVGLGIAFISLWALPSGHTFRARWVEFGLLISSCYLCLNIINKNIVGTALEKTLASKQIDHTRYFTAPTAFNNLLWYCVVESDLGYHIGYRSVFDESESIKLTFFPRNRELLSSIEEDEELGNLLQFSKGYYTVEKTNDALVFNDLRFGLVAGWEGDKNEFAFHYFLQQPGKNMLVVQRGRFAEWNISTMKSMAHRISSE
jgi:inner membrane protein